MDIMLIGGGGRMMDAMIDKLHKEGHRIYVLDGDAADEKINRKVFQYYHISYESAKIWEVFESVNADAVVCMGAFDTNFHWESERKESVRYSARMFNIFTGFSLLRRGRMVYLSSHEIYDRGDSEPMPEERPAAPKGFRQMVLAQVEQSCMSFARQTAQDFTVLRLDHLCQIPVPDREPTDPCGRMCLEALRTGSVTVRENLDFSLLYLSDAVEFIYQVLYCERHERQVYNLSSGEVINEQQLAELVAKQFDAKVSVQSGQGASGALMLASRRFREEFSGKVFYPSERIVKTVADSMKKHRAQYEKHRWADSEERMTLWQKLRRVVRALVPFAENLILFIPFFMLNNRATDSLYFSRIDFYLLYVLLFAVVYGQQQATFSALLATAGFLFRQMYERTGFEVMIDYNTYVWVAQIFILGFVVGYLKDQLKKLRLESRQESGYLRDQIRDVEDINSGNMRMKNLLAQQLVGQNDSLGHIYSITSRLNDYEPEEVLFYAADVVAKIMGAQDVAIYVCEKGNFARLYSSTSEKARKLGKSIRYRECGELTAAMEREEVYINRALSDDYPLMAKGLYENGALSIMIMVWSVPWDKMTLSEADKLTVAGQLIRDAVLRSNRYLKALEEKRYISNTKILEPEAFRRMVRACTGARDNSLTECTVLSVQSKLDEQALTERIGSQMRDSDYFGKLDNGAYYILLCNTGDRDAEYVIRRLEPLEVQCSVEKGSIV